MSHPTSITWHASLHPDRHGKALHITLMGADGLAEYEKREHLSAKIAAVEERILELMHMKSREHDDMDDGYAAPYTPTSDGSTSYIDSSATVPDSIVVRGTDLHELEQLQRHFDSRPQPKIAAAHTRTQRSTHLRLVARDGVQVDATTSRSGR